MARWTRGGCRGLLVFPQTDTNISRCKLYNVIRHNGLCHGLSLFIQVMRQVITSIYLRYAVDDCKSKFVHSVCQ